MIIALEGIIGVGKSHFLEVIRKNFSNVKIFTEGIDKDIYKQSVKDYYKEPHKYAYPFQLTMLWRKMSDGLDAQEYDNQTERRGIALIERTISSNNYVFAKMAYERKYITEAYFKLYNHAYEKLKKALKCPDLIIYLDCPESFAFQNIVNRGREGEEHITIEYLNELRQLYFSWLLRCDRRYMEKVWVNELSEDEKLCCYFQNILNKYRKIDRQEEKDKKYTSMVKQMEILKQMIKEFEEELKGERF